LRKLPQTSGWRAIAAIRVTEAKVDQMIVKYGNGSTEYGPGVSIELTGDEVATAIDAWLVAHDVHVSGPRTVTVNRDRCAFGRVYVDPSGFVIADGEKISGRGPGVA
jgi:hypothetical protein